MAELPPVDIAAAIPENLDEEILKMAAFGTFMTIWAQFELIVEMLIMRELRLTPMETSIICGGLGFGAKANALYSLLNRDKAKNEIGVRLLAEAQVAAQRNWFAHGFLILKDGQMELVRREVKGTYIVRKKKFSAQDLMAHANNFIALFNKCQLEFRISNADLDNYGSEIAALR